MSTSNLTNVGLTPHVSPRDVADTLEIPDTFEINRERAIDYLNTRDYVYVFDGYAGVGLSAGGTHLFSWTDAHDSYSGIPSTASRSG